MFKDTLTTGRAEFAKRARVCLLWLIIACGMFANLGCDSLARRYALANCADPVDVTIEFTHIPSCRSIDNPCEAEWGEPGTKTVDVDNPDFYVWVNGTCWNCPPVASLCYNNIVPLTNTSVAYHYENEVTTESPSTFDLNTSVYYGDGHFRVTTTGNSPPLAVATATPSVVEVNDPVKLDGSGTMDGEGSPLTYSWSITSAPAGSTASIADPSASVTSFTPDVPGPYSVHFIANDGTDDSNPVDLDVYAVNGFSDLGITKTADHDPLLFNTPVTYTITVTNYGPDDAEDVVVTDTLPTKLGIGPLLGVVSATASNGTVCDTSDPETVTCDIGDMLLGDPPVIITMDAVVIHSLQWTSTLFNIARVNTRAAIDYNVVTDPNEDNNRADARSVLLPPNGSDLAVTVNGTPDPVVVDHALTYDVQVTTNGPNTAFDVVLFEYLPFDHGTGGSLVNINSITPSQGECFPPADPATGHMVECHLGQVVLGHPPVTVTINATPPGSLATFPDTFNLRNEAYVTTQDALSGVHSGNYADYSQFNNDSFVDTLVLPAVGYDLAITKSASPNPVIVNNFLTYTLTVRNNGPQAAQDVRVFDLLPKDAGTGNLQVDLQNINAPPGVTCFPPANPLSNEVECQMDALPAGSPFNITLTVSPTVPTAPNLPPLKNMAEVTTINKGTPADLEVFEDNNTASASTIVLPTASHNTPPIAGDDNYTTDEDTDLTANVLGNDNDAENDPLNVILTQDVSHGTLVFDPVIKGKFTYTPDQDFNGSDEFRYVANDGNASSNEAAVHITVNAVNDLPVAVADIPPGPYLVGDPIQFDGSNSSDVETPFTGLTFAWQIISQPATSTAALDDATIVSPTITPDAEGDYEIQLIVNDGTDDSLPVSVTFHVDVTNTAPVANDDSYNTPEETELNANVLDNDTDAQNNVLSAVLDTDVAHGTLVLNTADGSFSYTPDTDYNGDDSFTYHANDGSLDSNVATVTITVDPVNDAPVAHAAITTTAPFVVGNPVDFDGSGSTDVDNDPATLTYQWSITSKPALSTATLTGDTTATPSLTPDVGGSYVIRLVVNDGALDSAPDSVLVSVEVCGPGAVSWVNPGDGTWGTPANWSTGLVPTATDDVCIDDPDTAITVTVDGGVGYAVNSLRSSETITVTDGATLTLNAASTIYNTLNLTNTLAAVDGPGDLTLKGAFNFEDGTISGSGHLNAEGGIVFGQTSAGSKVLGRNTLIPTGKEALWLNGNIQTLDTTAINNYGTFRVRHPGSFSIINKSGVAIRPFNNFGTFIKEAPSSGTVGTTSILLFHSFNNQGSVQILAGTLRIANGIAGLTDNGTMTVSAGASISLSASGNVADLTGAGDVTFAGGILAVNGIYNISGQTDIQSATVDFSSASAPVINSLRLQSGTIEGSSNVTIGGAFDWQGGTMQGTGTTVAAGGGTINASSVTLNRQLDIAPATEMVWQAGYIQLNGPATLNNNGTFRIKHEFTNNIFGGGTTARTINNAGTFIKDAPDSGSANAGPTNLGFGTVYFNNTGSVIVNDGRLNFYQGTGDNFVTGNGSYTVNAPGFLAFTAKGHIGPVNGDGSVLFYNSQFDIDGAFNVTGSTEFGGSTSALVRFLPASSLASIGSTLTVSGGHVDFSSGESPIHVATYNQSGSTTVVSGSDDITVSGLTTFNGGRIEGASATTALNVNGGLLMDTTTQKNFGRVVTLPAGQTATWADGNIGLYASGTFHNFGTFLDQHNSNRFILSNGGTGTKMFINHNIYAKDVPGGGGVLGSTSVNSPVIFENRGTLTLLADTFIVNNGAAYSQTDPSASTVLNGGNVSTSTTAFLNIQDGVLTGQGSVTGDVHIAGGEMAPGINVGSFGVTSDYVQSLTGSLNIEIGGLTPVTEHDQLVNGTSAIAGTLNVTLVGGFVPTSGDTFVIETHTSSSGNFATINGPGGTWTATYNTNNITLTAP